MQRLVAVALATCNTLYITIILCSGLVFGQALEADVLSNVNRAAMAPLIGPAAAGTMAAVVRIGYLLSLVGSYVLLCYPMRQVRVSSTLYLYLLNCYCPLHIHIGALLWIGK